MLLRIAVIAMAALLMSCQQEDSSDLIKIGGQPGGGSGGNKPKESLHPHVLLLAAGWADLHTLILSARSKDPALGCVERTTNSLHWNCEFGKLSVTRRGSASLSSQSNVTSVVTPQLGLYNFVKLGRQIFRGLQDYDLTLVQTSTEAQRFRYITTTDVAGLARGTATYRFEWDLSGTFSQTRESTRYEGAEGQLTVVRKSRSGTGWTESRFSFEMSAKEPLLAADCGQFSGSFSFSGHKQDAITVIADSAKGLRSSSGGRFLPWPACEAPNPMYGLQMIANFWNRPQP